MQIHANRSECLNIVSSKFKLFKTEMVTIKNKESSRPIIKTINIDVVIPVFP